MSSRRVIVRIERVVIDARQPVDLRSLEAEIRAGIASAFQRGAIPEGFARSERVLTATHGGIRNIGAAIAGATPPRRPS